MNKQNQSSKVSALSKDSNFEDIVNAIKEDHEALRKFGAILKSEDSSMSEKKEAFKNFSSLLKSHSKSEEKAVYDRCLDVEDLAKEAHEGYIEHEIADALMKKITAARNEDKWEAMVKVLAEVVEHHADEEESELLPEVQKEFETDERKQMTKQFVTLRENSQKGLTDENAGVLARLNEQSAERTA